MSPLRATPGTSILKRLCWPSRRCSARSMARRPKKGSSCRRGSSMWWHKNRSVLRLAQRFLAVIAIGGLTAACFQPLYGDRSLTGEPSLKNALKGVDIDQIVAPNGTALSRIAVAVRNDLVFETTGGEQTPPPTHRLKIKLTSTST